MSAISTPDFLCCGLMSTGMPRPVVDDAAAAVGQQGDVDAVAVAGHRLVDGVVDDLPDEVVQAVETGRADVHAGPFADRLEALQDREVLGRRRSQMRAPKRALPAPCDDQGAKSGAAPERQKSWSAGRIAMLEVYQRGVTATAF